MGKCVLLTGATGFTGARVAQRMLQAGYDLHYLARAASLAPASLPPEAVRHTLEEDVGTLPRLLEQASPDVVIHLAAVSRAGEKPADIDRQIDANFRLPVQLMLAMQQVGIRRFVNTGTSWQVTMGDSFSPFNFYAATKQACENAIDSFCHSGLRAITLRLFDVYGPDDPRAKIVDLVAGAMAEGRSLAMSPGDQLIDFVHVDDVAEAFLVAAERTATLAAGSHEIYGVSGGDRRPLRAIVDVIGRIAGKPVPIDWGGRPYRDREIMQPWNTFQPLPGWQPRIALESGLRDVLSRYEPADQAGSRPSVR